MTNKQKSRWSKIFLICITLTIVDKGWVQKTYTAEYAAGLITKELLCAVATLASSLITRSYINSGHSAADRVLHQEITRIIPPRITPERSVQHVPPVSAQVVQRSAYVEPVSMYKQATPSITQKKERDTKNQTVSPAEQHAQVIEVAAAVVTQKAQTLVYNLSLDCHKQVAESCRQAVRSVYVDPFAAQWEAARPQWTPERHSNDGITYHAPNPIFSAYCGPVQRTRMQAIIDRSLEEYYQDRSEYLQELMEIHNNPERCKQIHEIIDAFIETAQKLVYGSFVERVTAFLHLATLQISGRTYGGWLAYVKQALYAAYAHKDGSICMNALQDTNAARDILCTYSNAQLFSAHAYSKQIKRCKLLAKKPRNVEIDDIRCNQTNQCCKDMLSAFADGDMQTVEQIKNKYSGLNDLAVLHDALKVEYNKFVRQQEALLHDHQGIIHFQLPYEIMDPLYKGLSSDERAQLQHDKTALASFNDILRLRNLYKQALHKAWNIPLTADPIVHQTLYALIGTPFAPNFIDKIHVLVGDPDLQEKKYRVLIDALFLPNGIVKDFVDYERAQSLNMPAAILKTEYSNIRKLLNHLVYTEHVSNDQKVKNSCAQAIQYLQKSVTSGNKDVAQLYYLYAQGIYTQLDRLSSDRILNPGSQDIPQVHKETIEEDQLSDGSSESIRGSCGTGRQEIKIKNIGSCLPVFHVGSQDTHSTSEDKHVTPDYDSDKELPRPCGYQGQTLLGMGASDTAVEEGKEVEENKETEEDVSKADEEISSEAEDQKPKIAEKPNEIVVEGLAAKLGDALVKVEGRGKSRGRHDPKNFLEELAMYEVMSNPQGLLLEEVKMKDQRWPAEEGWKKYAQNVNDKNGNKVEIHYVYSKTLNLYDDFKFKD